MNEHDDQRGQSGAGDPAEDSRRPDLHTASHDGGDRNRFDGTERRRDFAEWRAHVDRRLDQQDELLRDIRTALIAGRWGLIAIRWIAGTAAALFAAWAALKGLNR